MKRHHPFLWIKIAISIAIIGAVIWFFDVRILESFGKVANPEFLLMAAIFPLVVNPLISNNRWKLFLHIQGVNVGILTLFRISFIATFLGLLLPSTSGSDAIRVLLIEKKTAKAQGAGMASVVMERMIGFMVLTFLGVIGASICLCFGISYYLLLLMLIMHSSFLFVFFCIKNKRLQMWISNHSRKIGKASLWVQFLNDAYHAFVQLKIGNILLGSILLILLFQVSTILCASLLFFAFDVNLPFYYHLALMPVIQIISILPVSVSGFGLREGGFVYFYGLLGINPGISLLVSILYYLNLAMLPALIGMILFLASGEAEAVDSIKS